MLSKKHLLENCDLLGSSKISDRKKALENVLLFLQKYQTNECDRDFDVDDLSEIWGLLLDASKKYLSKELEKTYENHKKKGTPLQKPCGDVLFNVIKLTIKEEADIEISRLFNYINASLETKEYKFFEGSYLNLISNTMLPSAFVRGKMQKQDWELIFNSIKHNLQGDSNSVIFSQKLAVLASIVEYGPSYSLPPEKIREQFVFVKEICNKVNKLTPRDIKEHIMNILYYFCLYNAKDNRMACCKLGEEIFCSVASVYEISTRIEKSKITIINFLLLQIVLHHPKGISEDFPAAYAYNWENWNNILDRVLQLLNEDVTINMNAAHKNTLIFIKENDSWTMLNEFVTLLAEIVRQCQLRDLKKNRTGKRDEKRQKVETCLSNIVSIISRTQFWPWINLMCVLLEFYPELLNAQDFTNLLQVLCKLQVDTKDLSIIHHKYACLSILHDIQSNIVGLNKVLIDATWKTISDTTLRAFGLNIKNKQIHRLLQKLISGSHTFLHENIIDIFYNQSVSEYNIKTLDVSLRFLNLSETKFRKDTLLQWLLDKNNLKNSNYLAEEVTSKVVVSLILKQWWQHCKSEDGVTKKSKLFDDIADIYLKTNFEDGFFVFNKDSQKSEIKKSVCEKTVEVNLDSLKLLENLLNKLLDELQSDMDILTYFNFLIFLKNISSSLINLNITSLENFWGLIGLLYKLLDTRFGHSVKLIDETSVDIITTCVKVLSNAFSKSENRIFEVQFRELMPSNVLKTVIDLLQMDVSNKNRSSYKSQVTLLKIEALKLLINFSCGTQEISLVQHQILEVVLEANYIKDFKTESKLVLSSIQFLLDCKPVNISDDFLTAVLMLLRKVCEKTYFLLETALEILATLHKLFEYVAKSQDDEVKIATVQILCIFYQRYTNYGPDYADAIINCIGKLYEVDPDCHFSKWALNNEEEPIILTLPQFLSSNYQQVRLTALKNIILFYQISNGEQFKLQKEMFNKIIQMSNEVFEVENVVSEERKIDESVTRSASVLHTFGGILATNYLWREHALMALIKISYERKLDSFLTVLKMVAKQMNLKNHVDLLEYYLPVFVKTWIFNNYPLDDFPILLFGCPDTKMFYQKYASQIFPIIEAYDNKNVNAIANYVKRNVEEITHESLPKMFSLMILQNRHNLSHDILIKNNLTKILDINVYKKQILERIDEVLLFLTEIVQDKDDFFNKFGQEIKFSVTNDTFLSADVFLKCLALMKDAFFNGQNLIPSALNECSSKIQKLVMNLYLKIYNGLALEDKLKYFYQYTLICDLIIQNLSPFETLHDFFIRDFVHSTINLIQNYEKTPQLSLVAAIFLKTLLAKVLPQFLVQIKNHFNSIICTLKSAASRKDAVGQICLDILKLLIVQEKVYFKEEIKHLDPFSNDPIFVKINAVYKKLKYDQKILSLEEEIYYFLNFGKSCPGLTSREDGLKHLKMVLSTKKSQLKLIYHKLKKIRGFAEDCENSLIHQLICMLVKLSCCGDANVNVEAIRCLGELGPADLMTLVVEPEKKVSFQDWTPFEFAIGQIITMLSGYIVDLDVQVIKPSVEALYVLLNTKEGRKVAESEDDFGFDSRINENHLVPFFVSKKPLKSTVFNINAQTFLVKIDNEELWCPQQNITHDFWVINLVCSLLETFMGNSWLSMLIAICKLKVEFCELMLPSLIYLIQSLQNSRIFEILEAKIDLFFHKHWRAIIEKNQSENIVLNKKSVQCILKIVHFLRVNRSNTKLKRPLNELNLDYLKVAQAAQYCTAHFTSILYVELWCRRKIFNGLEILNSENILSRIYETETNETVSTVHNILRSAYKAIGDQDSLTGCGTSSLRNPELRVEHYKQAGLWSQVLHHYSLQISQNNPNSMDNFLDSMQNCGLYEIPNMFPELDNYECLWRLSKWDLPERKKNFVEKNQSYEKIIEKRRYFALKSLHENDSLSVFNNIDSARQQIIENLKHMSLESSKNLYLILTHLQVFNEIEDLAKITKNELFLADVVEKWSTQDEINKNDFQYIEQINTQRVIVLNDLYNSKKEQIYLDNLIKHGLKLAELARLEGNNYVGPRILSTLQNLPDLTINQKAKIQLEDAQFCWVNHPPEAKDIVRILRNNEDIDQRIRSFALKLNGKWLMETNTGGCHSIIDDYFIKSLSLLENLEKTPEDYANIYDTYYMLGRFADGQYQQITEHINSDFFQRRVQNMNRAKVSLSSQKETPKNNDEKRAQILCQRQINIDQQEIENTRSEKQYFLELTLSYYLKNLLNSDKNNLQMFRVFSLLLENRRNIELQKLINEKLHQISSYKFLIVLPQIVPHIDSDDLFSTHVKKIVQNCAKDHPHHTLPILLSLANSNKDKEFTKCKNTQSQDPRTINARKLLKELKKLPSLNKILEELEFLSEALIELAYYTPKGDEKTKYEIPRNLKIRKIKNFSNITVPTDTIGVQKNSTYNNIIGISQFEANYFTVGGINAPKKLICKGLDGVNRNQLVKGKDDLRQDAVMQQVFTIMNNLLSINKQTNKLLIRTYRVVPLSMRSGILEWVDDSMPLGLYLTGDRNESIGAHKIYRPNDKTASECRSMLKKVQNSPPDDKLKAYNQICKIFKPVFHKFFESSFLHPSEWFERRRAYIHSVATSSMCGYILGIGDRHVSNILIDKKTAEVIHIDFGIAFEQGRVLPTPETVPFRLTRDIVDGMGISGVEGTFRRSCEKTMTVLRENAQTIMTILEVLLYDPLYSWAVSTEEANKRQNDFENSPDSSSSQITEGSVNITAERAILKMKAKLEGIAEAHPTSVEHQVEILIQQAMNPSNLCRLFNGWQPYL